MSPLDRDPLDSDSDSDPVYSKTLWLDSIMQNMFPLTRIQILHPLSHSICIEQESESKSKSESESGNGNKP